MHPAQNQAVSVLALETTEQCMHFVLVAVAFVKKDFFWIFFLKRFFLDFFSQESEFAKQPLSQSDHAQ